MAIVSIILGIILVICGFSTLFTPLIAFLGLSTLLAMVLLIWSIITVIGCASVKAYGPNFVLSIIGIIIAFFLMASPAASFVTDTIILILVAIFSVARGIISIIFSIKSIKEAKGKGAALGIISGILLVLVGGFCLSEPLFGAALLGVMVAFFIIFTGFDLITIGSFVEGES